MDWRSHFRIKTACNTKQLTPTYRFWKGGPDPAFPLLFNENPESRTFFHRYPESRFFFPKKYIKKSFPQKLINLRSDVDWPFLLIFWIYACFKVTEK